MAGLYIHIPFCKKACHYCNFHFSTNQKHKQDFIEALCKELQLRAKELSPVVFESVYFGGGTPSLLTKNDLNIIFQTIETYCQVSPNAEITLEANPDDFTEDEQVIKDILLTYKKIILGNLQWVKTEYDKIKLF